MRLFWLRRLAVTVAIVFTVILYLRNYISNANANSLANKMKPTAETRQQVTHCMIKLLLLR